MKADPRVDAYITKAPDFARPILLAYRKRLHAADKHLTENIKWNVPFFLRDGIIVASMAAFKKHTKLGTWTPGPRMGKPDFVDATEMAMIPSVADIKARFSAASKQAAPKKTPAKKKSAKKKSAKLG